MKKVLLKVLTVIVRLYIIICVAFFFFQEKIIFLPETLEKNYQFNFEQKFEERNFLTADGKLINGLLFRADSTKGLIFYLHGNAGSLKDWGNVADTYSEFKSIVHLIILDGMGHNGMTRNEDYKNELKTILGSGNDRDWSS